MEERIKGGTSPLRVAIIGTGKLGTDLLIKVMRSKYLDCVAFVGRNAGSEGLRKAQSLGVRGSAKSIEAFTSGEVSADLVFDASSAEHHRIHAPIFERLKMKTIDLTPAKVGVFCVPAINRDAIFDVPNINMVTCGGQASIPLIDRLSRAIKTVHKIEVQSFLAEDSVGPGTIANIEEYYSSTAAAVTQYTGVEDVSVSLELEKSSWKPDMLTCIRLHTDCQTLDEVFLPLHERLMEVRKHVPGYQIVGTPKLRQGVVEVSISVRGYGDWLPVHAGNLDIINCAAISVAEHYAAGRRDDACVSKTQSASRLRASVAATDLGLHRVPAA